MSDPLRHTAQRALKDFIPALLSASEERRRRALDKLLDQPRLSSYIACRLADVLDGPDANAAQQASASLVTLGEGAVPELRRRTFKIQSGAYGARLVEILATIGASLGRQGGLRVMAHLDIVSSRTGDTAILEAAGKGILTIRRALEAQMSCNRPVIAPGQGGRGPEEVAGGSEARLAGSDAGSDKGQRQANPQREERQPARCNFNEAMSPIVIRGLQDLTARTNLETGLTHPSDMNAAKEMFVRLHEAGEPLLAHEIEHWALANGWQSGDAKSLGRLGAEIGNGKKPRITNGPWWQGDIIDKYKKGQSGKVKWS